MAVGTCVALQLVCTRFDMWDTCVFTCPFHCLIFFVQVSMHTCCSDEHHVGVTVLFFFFGILSVCHGLVGWLGRQSKFRAAYVMLKHTGSTRFIC